MLISVCVGNPGKEGEGFWIGKLGDDEEIYLAMTIYEASNLKLLFTYAMEFCL